jgi:hypothetical protein
MLRKETPENILSKPEKYIREVGGLNNVESLAHYLKSLSSAGRSLSVFYTEKKPTFQRYLDIESEKAIMSDNKVIKEITGDADFITSKKRKALIKKITDSGVKFTVLMDIEPYTLHNAEDLRDVGVEVLHAGTSEHYHFGTISGNLMWTLWRTPTNGGLKVVSIPQDDSLVERKFLSTDYPDLVSYTNQLWEEQRKRAVTFEEKKAEIERCKTKDATSRLLQN